MPRSALVRGGIALGLVALIAVFGGVFLRGGCGEDASRTRAQFLAAVARGDSAAARTLVDGLDPAFADTGEGRLMLAANAALAGHLEAAEFWLGDPGDLKAPLHCEGTLLAAGIHRLDGPEGSYLRAAEDYRRVLDDPGCTVHAGAARDGLSVSCLIGGHEAREICDGVQVLGMRSNAERELILSMILVTDGHGTAARNRLQQALGGIQSGQQVGCAGLSALRSWAAPGRLGAGDALLQRLGTVGRRQARTAADCALFGGLGDRG